MQAHPGKPFCFRQRFGAGPARAHQLRTAGKNMPRGGEGQTDPRPMKFARKLNEDQTMKKGRNLEALVSELLRQAESKRDFLTPANRLTFDCNGTGPTLEVDLAGHPEAFPLRDTGHQQLAERLEIPKTYYDRMREEAPFLLEENVRTWLGRSEKQFLVRTLDGQARAILSDRYRVLDNDDLANAALPVLVENDFEIVDRRDHRAEVLSQGEDLEDSGRGEARRRGSGGDRDQQFRDWAGDPENRADALFPRLLERPGHARGELRRQHVGRHVGELEAAGITTRRPSEPMTSRSG